MGLVVGHALILDRIGLDDVGIMGDLIMRFSFSTKERGKEEIDANGNLVDIDFLPSGANSLLVIGLS